MRGLCFIVVGLMTLACGGEAEPGAGREPAVFEEPSEDISESEPPQAMCCETRTIAGDIANRSCLINSPTADLGSFADRWSELHPGARCWEVP